MDLLPSLARLVLTRIGWVFATGDSWDAEILALRHQIFVLQRQVDRPRFNTIWNEHPLRQLVEEYVEHYNSQRPHRGLHQRAPNETEDVTPIGTDQPIQRHTTCAGLINEYRTAA